MASFLENLKGSKNGSKRGVSRTKVFFVEQYLDEEHVQGYEMGLTEEGFLPLKDAQGQQKLLTVRLNDESHENRPTIASLKCEEGAWDAFQQQVLAEIKQYQTDGTRGSLLQGTLFDDIQKVLREDMTLEGALRKNNRMVEPGGILQFEGCVDKGDIIEANWVRTLSHTWGERLVIPPSVAMIAIQPVQVTVEKSGGEKVRLTGDNAVEALNKMNVKDAIEKSRVPVDIILPGFATTTKTNVAEAIRDKFEFLISKLPGAEKNASVYVRVMVGEDPAMVFKTSLGGELTGTKMVEGEPVEVYKSRSPESAVARHLDNKRNMGDDSEMTYRDIYAALEQESDVTLQVIPAISTVYSKGMKSALLEKTEEGFGTKLLNEATGQFVPDLDENGVPRKITVETMEGPIQKDARRFVSCFTNCISASMTIDLDDQIIPAILRTKSHLPKSNENFKAYPLMKEEQLPHLVPLQVKKPSSIIDNLSKSQDLSAPQFDTPIDDMPDLGTPVTRGQQASQMGM